MANLLEHVIVIDRGRILVASTADDLRGATLTLTGRSDAVEEFIRHRQVLDRAGRMVTATVAGPLDDLAVARAVIST